MPTIGGVPQLPTYFIPNIGQLRDETIHYYARGTAHGVFFTSDQVIFSFDQKAPDTGTGFRFFRLDLRFLESNLDVEPEGRMLTSGKVHYLKGNDPAKWHADLPVFEEVIYRQLWPGIDLVFRGYNQQIKYEFIVHPGANPKLIRLAYEGSDRLFLDENGDLVIDTALGAFKHLRPSSYQEREGEKYEVPSHFQLGRDGELGEIVGFSIGKEVDPDYPLIIDPGLEYSTFFGVASIDQAQDVAIDAEENAYVTGYTQSPSFPITPGVFSTILDGPTDAFVTKLNATDSSPLIYTTFIGGSQSDNAYAIAIDSAGNAYITGSTFSADFPVTVNAYSTTIQGGEEVFVTKLNSSGSALLYSTFVGGSNSEQGAEISVDTAGNAYVTGYTFSTDFPTTSEVLFTTRSSSQDAFVIKLNATGSTAVCSTYLESSDQEQGFSLDVDSAGNASGNSDQSANEAEDALVTKRSSIDSPLLTCPPEQIVFSDPALNGVIADHPQSIATDPCGGSASCSFAVTVLPVSADGNLTPSAVRTRRIVDWIMLTSTVTQIIELPIDSHFSQDQIPFPSIASLVAFPCPGAQCQAKTDQARLIPFVSLDGTSYTLALVPFPFNICVHIEPLNEDIFVQTLEDVVLCWQPGLAIDCRILDVSTTAQFSTLAPDQPPLLTVTVHICADIVVETESMLEVLTTQCHPRSPLPIPSPSPQRYSAFPNVLFPPGCPPLFPVDGS